MNRMIPRPFVAVLIGLGFTSIAHAAASGTAKLTGCAPAGGVMGECSMTKGTADPQTYHNIWCILDKNNIIMDEINEANPHYVPAGTGENHLSRSGAQHRVGRRCYVLRKEFQPLVE